MLAHYSERLNGVELNGSFYRTPPESTLAKWAEGTPPSFRFCMKAHRGLTYSADGFDRVGLARIISERMAPLGDRLTHRCGGLRVLLAGLQVQRRGGRQRPARAVVDQLRVHVVQAAVNAEPRPLGAPSNPNSHPTVPLPPSPLPIKLLQHYTNSNTQTSLDRPDSLRPCELSLPNDSLRPFA